MPHHKAPFRFGTVVVQSICYLRKALCNGLFIARSNRSVTRTEGVPSLPTHKVIEEAYRLGASFVLPKPFTARALVDKSVSNLKEVITRGAKVLVVTNRDVRASDIDTLIRVPETHPLLAPAVSILPYQLLSYYIAKQNGLDVDKPRNLAKSVTVE